MFCELHFPIMYLRSNKCYLSLEDKKIHADLLTNRAKEIRIVRRRIMARIQSALGMKGLEDSTALAYVCVSSWNELLDHLESQFEPHMTWKNIHRWDIDHVLPLCAFDFSRHVHQLACFHHSNLKPRWWIDNARKAGNYDASLRASRLRSMGGKWRWVS